MIERRPEIRQESLDVIHTYLRRAIKERATDIHWEPHVETSREYLVVRLRVDGILRDIDRIADDRTKMGSMINAIKTMADLDPTDRRHQQDGRFTFVNENVEFDIRVATMPTIGGEKIAMRLMDRNKYCMKLSELGMTQEIAGVLESMIYRPEGFVVISGPTGSGKTTTLYSVLQHIYSREKNICTIEDPVEVKFPGINQIQVEPDFGMCFVSGLRAILRQDPNIIAVGEMRDAETVRTALQAALTGAMVLSTIHARDAVNTIVRLLDMGVEPFFIATALTGILSQRLVRLTCRVCRGRGCVQCASVGYKKRIGMFEILKVNDMMRELILKRASAEALREAAVSQGMLSFHKSVEPLLAQELTTKDEIERVLSIE